MWARPVVAFLGLLCALFSATPAHATRVRVHGTAKLSMEVLRGTPATIRGLLRDDTGAPIAGERVVVSVEREGAPADASVRAAMLAAKRCSGTEPVYLEPDSMGPRTDDEGRFCLTLLLGADRYRVHASYAGDKLTDGAKLDLPADLVRARLRLAFDPELHTVALEAKSTTLEATAATDENGALEPAAGKSITLFTESGAEIARETTNVSGRARFVVPTARLGSPGKGELRLTFAGDADTAFADVRSEIDRVAPVELTLSGPVPEGATDDGVPAAIDVSTAASGPVSEGSVEAHLHDVVVGMAPVTAGHARLVLTFASHGPQPVEVHVRYVPVSPFYRAQAPLLVKVSPGSGSPWKRAPLVVLAVAVLAFLILFRRQQRVAPKVPSVRKEELGPIGHARVDMVKPVQYARSGWTGEVVDAHEGTPVNGADVRIERPSFQAKQLLAQARADAQGRWKLAHVEVLPGDELVVSGPLHSELPTKVPPEGELRIALVLRKRAILASLVKWARAKGGAYDGKPEPTPGLVRRLASHDYRTARWADAVEQGAFDAVTVDRAKEREIEALRPDAPEPVLGNVEQTRPHR
jgi:5-hydroxyisourate hydrolase-like protein (transthyretin family)